ncbi:tetratricopeptide repeat protein [Sorangium sp. So ce1078]|uniref:tetratricopeptide repeat protein n=1 Tax=Sorangium sp. So ce1078 TaxID=3133329 RepID=UPI003F60AC07
MRRARDLPAIRCALSLAVLCAGHAASAQTKAPKDAAYELFQQGLVMAEAHDCPRALPLFRQSQALYASRGTLYNLALCEREIGQVASAWRHFKELLPQLSPDDPRLPTAKQQLTELEPRLPRLIVKLADGAPAPAEVLLDQTAMPQASLGSELPVDPGDHVLVARWADGRQAEARVSLGEGARKDVRLEPPPAAAAPPAAPPRAAVSATPQAPSTPAAVPPPPASGTRRTLAFVVGGVGVAAVGGSLITGGLAIGAKGDLEEKCPDPSQCSKEGMSVRSRGQTLTTTSTVLGALGLAGIGAGLVLFLTTPEQGTSVALTPAILPGGGGALLRSRF